MFKSPEELREEFDQVALEFEKFSSGLRKSGNKKIRLLKEDLSAQLPSHGESALDIGCGLGGFLPRLAERFDHVVALDLSPEMVRIAGKNNSGFSNIDFIIADVNTWNFPIEQFDCVVSITTLHHMALEPILKKMKDALKPGGILLVGDFYERRGFEALIRKIAATFRKLRRRRRKSSTRSSSALFHGMGAHDPSERYLPFDEVRRICGNLLPDAKVMRYSRSNSHHYSIVWKKP